MKVLCIHDRFCRKDIAIPYPESTEIYLGDFAVYHDEESRENIGQVIALDREEEDLDKVLTTYSFLRKATLNDLQKMETQKQGAKKAMESCRKKVAEHKLDMQLAFTELSLDGNRVNFIFTSDDRVDFRELVKDLAKTFQKQIHLQQIGPRDKAKLVCGRGKCGKCLCCNKWMKNLESITMEMVRAQCLESKGSAKLSGCCGKLMCCLRYEAQEYREMRKNLPGVGSIIKVKKGEGAVTGLDILNQKVKVIFPDKSFEMIAVEDIKKVIKPEASKA